MTEEKKVVIASAPGPNIAELVKEAAKEGIEVEVQEVAGEQEQAPQLDEHSQNMMKLVEEIVDTFRPRVSSGELTPYQVAEALAVALTGTIYSIVPPNRQKVAQTEAESITRKCLKAFDNQVQKKNPMFASQLLGAAKVASYVVSHGNRVISDYHKNAVEAAQKTMDELPKSE
jgi:hypothetical protein